MYEWYAKTNLLLFIFTQLTSTIVATELPGNRDLIAFDAEFVSVQDEKALMNELGQKISVRETRHALARISVIVCSTGAILLDDHVLPREPVVDYLTRFSGIIPSDLDPQKSPHHLISTRSAYLKLRLLMERGCIWVGHGLSQDFLTANLHISPTNIIDTVELYHLPQSRYISLRYLANYVLKRDMQEEIHDSVEDAKAAHELYQRALEMKINGTFESFLNQLYEVGQKHDWKIVQVS